MARHELDPDALGQDEDWVGNNAAFTCPGCGKVFIVSAVLHRNGRECPGCGQWTGFSQGGQKSGGSAWIQER